jgi:phosphoribosylformimino-5-aminoimidazole carboxamide ribotide isomerase
MRVVGVIDLKGGLAVHARGGERHRYAPVRSLVLADGAVGDAVALARGYRHHLALDGVYVADLDAITGAPPQRSLVRQIADVGPTLWLDAGIGSVDRAAAAVEDGASVVVIGLETLSSFEDLAEVARAVGPPRVAFSLDLRNGVPVTREGAPHAHSSAVTHAVRAAEAGVGTIIVLDLARVGGRGIDVTPVKNVRRAVPGAALYAGGGVRAPADLTRLADAGCEGALVATALHDGAIGRVDVDRMRGLRP